MFHFCWNAPLNSWAAHFETPRLLVPQMEVRFKSNWPDFISTAQKSIMKVDGICGISSFKFGWSPASEDLLFPGYVHFSDWAFVDFFPQTANYKPPNCKLHKLQTTNPQKNLLRPPNCKLHKCSTNVSWHNHFSFLIKFGIILIDWEESLYAVFHVQQMFGIVDEIETTKLPSLSKADASKGRTCWPFPPGDFAPGAARLDVSPKPVLHIFAASPNRHGGKTQSNQIHPPKK